MKTSLRVALASLKHLAGAVEQNMANCEKWLHRALADRPDVVVFPEYMLTGVGRDPLPALPADAPIFATIQDWARGSGVSLMGGFVEQAGGNVHNSAFLARPDGRVAYVRKNNPTCAEIRKYGFEPGNELPVFHVAGAEIGLAICADMTYFETARILSFRGAEIVLAIHNSKLPALGNTREAFRRWRLSSWPVFARDNCIYLAGTNAAGIFEGPAPGEREHAQCGGALVVDWAGEEAAALTGDHKREGMLTVDLDLSGLRRARAEHAPFLEFRVHAMYHQPNHWQHGCGSSGSGPPWQ